MRILKEKMFWETIGITEKLGISTKKELFEVKLRKIGENFEKNRNIMDKLGLNKYGIFYKEKLELFKENSKFLTKKIEKT